MKKIWLDAGHGGSDPGAVANGLQEKELTLRIVKHAITYLNENYTGFEIKTTRLNDTTVDLNNRDDLADAWKADLYVSVHINAGKGVGFETFTYTGASAKSIALQNVLHNEILSTMKKFGDIKDRGNKKANYSVLRETTMPAVLTENLFIDSADHKFLKNEAFVKATGEAHARGIAKYLGLPAKPKPVAPPKPTKFYKVVVGAWASEESAEKILDQVIKAGFPGASIKYE